MVLLPGVHARLLGPPSVQSVVSSSLHDSGDGLVGSHADTRWLGEYCISGSTLSLQDYDRLEAACQAAVQHLRCSTIEPCSAAALQHAFSAASPLKMHTPLKDRHQVNEGKSKEAQDEESDPQI